MSICNRLDLQTLGSQPVMPKNLPDHCIQHEVWLQITDRLEDGHKLGDLDVDKSLAWPAGFEVETDLKLEVGLPQGTRILWKMKARRQVSNCTDTS